METDTILGIVMSVIITLAFCYIVARIYIRRHIVGTFRFNNGVEPMCTFELERIPEFFEKKHYVIAKVVKEDIDLPGTHKSQ